MRIFTDKKISTQILIFGVFMIVFSAALVGGLILLDNARYNDTVSNEQVQSALDDLHGKISEMPVQSELSAISIAQNYLVLAAVETHDLAALKTVLDKLNVTLNMNTITITDPNGDVLFRQHQPDKHGDSILSQMNVQKALSGATSTTLESGALVKLSARSGTPIYNRNGAIIGTVVTGITFENTPVLDQLKAVHHTEFTIFAGNEAIATTIMQDGQRASELTLDDATSKIVMEDGQAHAGNADILGTPYITKYEPLLDTNGQIVGAVFAGLSETNARAATITTLVHILIALPVIIGLSSVIMVLFINRRIKRPMNKLTWASEKLAHGDVDVEIDAALKDQQDEIGELARAFDTLIDSTKKQVTAIQKVADGDLTTEIDIRSGKDMLSSSLKTLVTQLHHLATSIITTSEQVAGSSNQVSNSSMALSQGATEQASAIEQLSASIEEIASQTSRNARNAEEASDFTRNVKDNAADGNRHMKEMLLAMDEINVSSGKIGEIIKVIDDIAFQTNILALNAAVEAARAGQHGKGFAVVAEEVRTLASKSANAAKETTELIENSRRKVGAGTKIANDTANALNQIVTKVEKSVELIGNIVTASQTQTSNIEQINIGISQVSQVVQTNAATAEESAAASEELSSQAEQLKRVVGVFKTQNGVAKQANPGRDTGSRRVARDPDFDPNRLVTAGDGGFGKY